MKVHQILFLKNLMFDIYGQRYRITQEADKKRLLFGCLHIRHVLIAHGFLVKKTYLITLPTKQMKKLLGIWETLLVIFFARFMQFYANISKMSIKT